MREKHESLLHSYSQQAEKVDVLTSQIENLTSQLDMLRSSNNDSQFSDLPEILSPKDFDAVPGHGMLYSGPQYYLDPNLEFPLGNGNDDTLLSHES